MKFSGCLAVAPHVGVLGCHLSLTLCVLGEFDCLLLYPTGRGSDRTMSSRAVGADVMLPHKSQAKEMSRLFLSCQYRFPVVEPSADSCGGNDDCSEQMQLTNGS